MRGHDDEASLVPPINSREDAPGKSIPLADGGRGAERLAQINR